MDKDSVLLKCISFRISLFRFFRVFRLFHPVRDVVQKCAGVGVQPPFVDFVVKESHHRADAIAVHDDVPAVLRRVGFGVMVDVPSTP